MMGKGHNNLKPDPREYGKPHSTFKKDPVTGKTTNYETYQVNENVPTTGLIREKRYDGVGGTHTNKVTGERISTPHVHDKNVPGGIREANPEEIP